MGEGERVTVFLSPENLAAWELGEQSGSFTEVSSDLQEQSCKEKSD